MKKLALLGLAFGLTACGDLPSPKGSIPTPTSVEKALHDTLNKAGDTAEGMADMAGDMKDGAMDMAKDGMDTAENMAGDMKDEAMDMAKDGMNAAIEVVTPVIEKAPEPILPEDTK